MADLNRRQFLAAASAFAVTGTTANAASNNPEVVVIGAGAAGIAAAQKLIAGGVEVVVLEANSRIGGRIYTDTSSFSSPYDTGAHWLHNGANNPFVRYGKKNGFSLYKAPDNELLFVGNRQAKPAEQSAYETASTALASAIEAAGEAGEDVSAASVAPNTGEWDRTAQFQVGPYEMGKNLSDFSCSDWYTGEGGVDWFCKEGFGTLWQHSARGVPVQLQTVAKTIRWGEKGVTIDTNKGSIRAKACIVTVSTGVLAVDGIRFSPALPVTKQEAFDGVSMGLYNHVALEFKSNIFGTQPDTFFTYQIGADDPGGVGFLTNVSGSTLTLADFGGDFAWEIEKQGDQAAIDFAVSRLRAMFGSKLSNALIKAKATNWGKDPLTRGSYASAKPGAQHLRRVLREPIGDRIWFAGEACSPSEWATVSGAHKSGQQEAKNVIRALKKI